MLTSVDVTLSATVTSVTGVGSFFYRGQPNETGESLAIRRDFTVEEIPGFFYRAGDRLEVRWRVDAAALEDAYRPDYQPTGETRFSNLIQLCGRDSSSWNDSDCDSRAGLRADELSRTCCRYFFEVATDSFFSTEGFVGPDNGMFTLRFPILRAGLEGAERFDFPYGLFEANISFDPEWTIATAGVPEPATAGLLALASS